LIFFLFFEKEMYCMQRKNEIDFIFIKKQMGH